MIDDDFLCLGAAKKPCLHAPRRWVDSFSPGGLRLLLLNERCCNHSGKGASLPHHLYRDVIAPFLQFEGPLSGQLYAIGGRNQDQEPLATVEMFNTWHGRWENCPSMRCPRAGSSAASLDDGVLMVAGGYDGRGIVAGVLDTCEMFDTTENIWRHESKANLLRGRWGHGCVFLDGRVFCVGGCSLRSGSPAHETFMETLRSCEVFHPSAGVWSPCADLNVARAGARVVALGDFSMAIVGGCDDVFGRADVLRSLEILDVRHLEAGWSILSSELAAPRTTAAVASIDEHRILIMGGAPSLSSAELYTLPTHPSEVAHEALGSKWVEVMPEGRLGCQAVCLKLPTVGKNFPVCENRCAVVVGGESGDDDDTSSQISQFGSVMVYDIDGEKWLPAGSFPPLPTPRTAMALCLGAGLITG